MSRKYRNRRVVFGGIGFLVLFLLLLLNPAAWQKVYLPSSDSSDEADDDSGYIANNTQDENMPLASEVLEKLEVKGRAPKTGYARSEFYESWPLKDNCNLRQRILKRDFGDTAVLDSDNCTVIAGKLYEPYTGKEMEFKSRSEISKGLQIDHIVALSDAWQKGAQYKSREVRYNIATDPMNLIAVDASSNQQKSDGDAATWLPKNKSFRCQYVARQVSVKYKYGLWVTSAEKTAISNILSKCPTQKASIKL